MMLTETDVEQLREAYEARATPDTLRDVPFDHAWATWQKESGLGAMSGESLGELTQAELGRWVRAMALQANAHAYQQAAHAAMERAKVEVAALFYDFSDRLGITEHVRTVVDPAAGVMRRQVAAPTATTPNQEAARAALEAIQGRRSRQ